MSVTLAGPVRAAEAGLDGSGLGLAWALPFAGLLLSIALCPLLVPALWHHHYGKIALLWGASTVVAMLLAAGAPTTADLLLHTALLEYVPFVLLLLALFTVTGGLRIDGGFTGSPASNTTLLAAGTALASIAGTTGAAMLLVRPLIRANAWRRRRVHTLIFFIFLVANLGGSLTPLGDPPLFLGFLKGIPFFWPTTNLLLPCVVAAAILLAVYLALDTALLRGDRPPGDMHRRRPLRVDGLVNLPLLGAVLGAVLLSGFWPGPPAFRLGTTTVVWGGLLRDAALILIVAASIALTPRATREANAFGWGPMAEVAKLFAAIFVTLVPVLAMLQAGRDGAFAPLVRLVSGPDGAPVNAMYFWATGGLSAFLDNAPTYLVFFNLAGGDPVALAGPLASTLAAISAGAVFMGAGSYIGNAPNFMVRAIAEELGIRMPSFFGYMAWSVTVLVPVFLLLTWLFFA